ARLNIMRPAQCRSGHLRQPERTDLAFAHEINKRSHAFFQRNIPVHSVQIVKINDVRVKTHQRLFACTLENFRPAVDRALAVHSGHAALACEHDLRSKWSQNLSEQGFVHTKPVKRGGIEVVDTELDGPRHYCGRLLDARWRRVSVAEVHA